MASRRRLHATIIVRGPERLRAGVAAFLVGAVAVLCVSSPVFATIAAALTIAAVIADVVAHHGRVIQPRPDPGRLCVDLTRRADPGRSRRR